MVNQSVLYQTNGNAPGLKYFTPMEAQLQRRKQSLSFILPAMKEVVKHKLSLSRQNCRLRRAILIFAGWRFDFAEKKG
jgi:hypothetical protein